MKKTAISLVLALVMLFSLVLVAAPQAKAAEHADHCVCGGTFAGVGEHAACTNVTWTELTAAVAAMPLGPGNYYLAADMELVTPLTIAFMGAEVNICLNGYTLKGNHTDIDPETNRIGLEGVVFNLALDDVKLTICDCKGTGVVESVANNAGSCIFQAANNTVTVFGGTYKGSTTTGSKAGATLRQQTAATEAVFNMYGGVFTRGNAGSYGGNIGIYGKMNMWGGSITDGVATKRGGNLYMAKTAVVTIYDGTITGGSCPFGPDGKSDIFITETGSLTIHNLQESFYLYYGETSVVDLSKADASLSVPADAGPTAYFLVTKTKTSGGEQGGTNTPATGDTANLVVMGLGMVIGVVGMACLLPKKQSV